MLLAVVSDPRLILARLAEHLVALRHARDLAGDAAGLAERERLAIEARAVFAPLASRLGVWQLKWELEDLGVPLSRAGRVPADRERAQRAARRPRALHRGAV